MFSDSDLLDDILPQPTDATERALGKFRPKARKKSENCLLQPSIPFDDPVRGGNTVSTMNLPTQLPVAEDNVSQTGAPLSEAVVFDNNDDMQKDQENSGRKAKLILPELDSLDDVLLHPNTITDRVMGKFQPKVRPNTLRPIRPHSSPSDISQPVSSAMDPLPHSPKLLETPELMNHSHSEDLVSDGDKDSQKVSGRLEKEQATVLSDLEPSDGFLFQTSTFVDHLSLSSENCNLEEGSIQFSSTTGEREPICPSFLFSNTEDHVATTEVQVLGAAGSGNDGDLQADQEQSGGEAADVFSNVDSIDAFLVRSNTTAVRTVGKFQPKANVGPKNKKLKTPPSTIPDAANSYDVLDPNSRSSVPTNALIEPVISNQKAIHAEVSQAEIQAVPVPSDTESFDKILSQSTATAERAVGKFQPKSVSRSKCEKPRTVSFALPDAVESVSPPVDFHPFCPQTEGSEWVQPDSIVMDSSHLLMTGDSVDKSPHSQPMVSDHNGDMQIDHGRLETEVAAEFSGLESLDDTLFQPTSSIARGVSRFQPKPNAKTKKGDLTEASGLVAASPDNRIKLHTFHGTLERDSAGGRKRKPYGEETLGEVQSRNVEVRSEGIMDEGPISENFEENEAGKSFRQLRKRTSVRSSVNELDDGNEEKGEVAAEVSSNSQMAEDNSDDEYREEEMPRQRRTITRPKRLQDENEKPVRRNKKASSGPDMKTREPSKKKFPHSTRRNRRRVDKILLETPEEDIDPRKLRIKDLLLLAEAKERISIKETAMLSQSVPDQSDGLFPNDTHFDDDDAFSQEQGLNFDGDEANHTVQLRSTKLNYHTYMARTRTERWSKSDTELFYQAIRQFGTDFAMIQPLFPNRTRHQVKLKFKNEERKHPLQIADALVHRSKDHSHFEMVIQRLQTQAEQNSNEDATDDPKAESQNASGENEVEENEKSGKKEEQEVNDWDHHGHSPVKSNEFEDVFEWSQYGNANSSSPRGMEKDEYNGF